MALPTTSAFARKPNYGQYENMFDTSLSKYGIGTNTDVGDSPIVADVPGASLTYNQRINDLTKTNTDLSSKLNEKSFFDKDTLGGFAGLGSVLLQAVALPDQLAAARTQRRALEQNMDTAREEQARRNRNIEGFNRVRPSQPTSAFMGAS